MTEAWVGARVELINVSWADRVFFGPATRALGVQWIENSATLSSSEEPVLLGAGVQARDSIFQWGAEVGTSAQVSLSILLEHSGAERQALVTESLIGPNTVVGGGEVTASFLGPFVGFHHQSLLIAAWWPEGRGNIGYGANIGSNHTSRSPDQELWAGEGNLFRAGYGGQVPIELSRRPLHDPCLGRCHPSSKTVASIFPHSRRALGHRRDKGAEPGDSRVGSEGECVFAFA